MEPITTPEELERFGFEVEPEAIMRASTRIRGWTGSPVNAQTVSETFWSHDNVRHLGARPVRRILSVTDADTASEVSWKRDGEARIWTPYSAVTVSYEAGFVVVPDEILEIVGAVAERISIAATSAAGRGISQEASGSTSISYSSTLVARAEQLTPAEKRTLAYYFPRGVRFAPVGGGPRC